jgi:Tfp pilus assembly protein PilF
LAGCGRANLPQPGSRAYRDLVRAFYVGLGGLESGEDDHAQRELTRATQLAPGEPAAWADLSLLFLRQQDNDAALTNMEKARSLAPDNSRIQFFLGDIESRRGRLDEAIAHYRRALDLDHGNVKALYALAEQTERQGTPVSGRDALALLRRILGREPDNTAVLVDTIRLGERTGDSAAVQRALEGLKRQRDLWPKAARQRLETLDQAIARSDVSAVSLQLAFLRNELQRSAAYRQSLNEVRTPASSAGDVFRQFLRLPSPSAEPAEPDTRVRFAAQSVAGAPGSGVRWVRPADLDGSGRPIVLWADGAGVHLPDGSILGAVADAAALAAVDLNYDFLSDLVLAGPRGLAVFEQRGAGKFVDITAHTGLPAAIVHGNYTGIWACDVDLDGDADLLLGVAGASPVALRNNGDGTFAVLRPFAGSEGAVSFAFADIDADGDPDLAMVGQDGELRIYMNERMGDYRERSAPASVASGVAEVAAADIDGDGNPDFVILKKDGEVVRLSDRGRGAAWDTASLVHAAPSGANAGLAIGDFDNNGRLDLVANGQLFLGGANGLAPAGKADIARADVADLDGDGRLDLVGVSGSGGAVELLNHGAKDYHWQTVRLRAAQAYGDQRIPSFGLGAEVEVRAGLLTEKQIATGPTLHFGLGEQNDTDLLRIVWPTGLVQVEFDMKGDQAVAAQQRLKGSCPSLFAWDGRKMTFVKDSAPWSTVLGVHESATKIAPVPRTTEWFNVPGKALVPHDGYYDLRVTDELWEVYYIDSYALLVVDHPAGTEIRADERYAAVPPQLKVYTTSVSQPFRRAVTDTGEDVAGTVANLDEKYLDNFGKGRYQNLTQDHWVELELPEEAPYTGPLYLIADGWADPADETTLIAMTHRRSVTPRDLSIEVPDAKGRWIVVRQKLGMPAGKFKTCVLDLTGIFQPGAPRKLRLRTNMEIYWDRLAWARGVLNAQIEQRELHISGAELRARGYSAVKPSGPSAPDVLEYDRLAGSGQKWRDIEGYYTRLGEVGELLQKVDDRAVIMASGDELRLRFPEQPAPPLGWLRDYVLIGDGWIKDGDLNTAFSATVLPLPYHEMKDYGPAPRDLESDPVYQKHAVDWELFHTRYISADGFRSALWR